MPSTLFTPFELKNLKLKNRIGLAPMTPSGTRISCWAASPCSWTPTGWRI